MMKSNGVEGAFQALALALLLTQALPVAAAEKHGDGHHPAMAKATSAFHDIMEPLWHMPAGAERVSKTCADSKMIDLRLRTMTKELGPKLVLGQMGNSVSKLADACKASRGADVEKELETLHHQFHQLMGM